MTSFLHTEADLEAGIAALVAPIRAGAGAGKTGEPPLRRREGGYRRAVRHRLRPAALDRERGRDPGRLFAAFDPFHHDTCVLRARATSSRGSACRAPKIKTIKEIGKAIAKGTIDLDALADMAADEAHAALIALHGIGPWTADIYLLFCLGHADAWPAGDLALQEAARIAFDLRAAGRQGDGALAEAWRPWRGVAAHLLWTYYHVVKRREGAAPAQATGRRDAKSRKRQEASKG